MWRWGTRRMSRSSTWRRARFSATSSSAKGRGASPSPATRRPSMSPMASVTTCRSSIPQAARRKSRSRSAVSPMASPSMSSARVTSLLRLLRGRLGRSGARLALAIAALIALASVPPALAQTTPDKQPEQHVKIAFVSIDNDPRYEPLRAYERIVLKTREHPLTGAEVGIDEANALKRVLNADFTLDRIVAKSPADVAPAVLAALEAGTHFFLIDAPTEAFKPLAAAVRGRDALLFNVSEPDDSLRREVCAAEFVHVYPSRAQLMDGLVQY